MIRTQIQLTNDQTREIKDWARERGVSMAAIIREAVDEHLRRRGRASRQEIVARAIAAAGSTRSGSGDVSLRHDEYFAEAAEERGSPADDQDSPAEERDREAAAGGCGDAT